MNTDQLKPYDRQPDEPNLWYDRFFKFMLLGPERSLIETYRQISNAARAAKGQPPLRLSARIPQSWRQRASQFDWKARAESWDNQQRRLTLKKVERTRSMAMDQSQDAMQVQIDLMHGELKDPDGQLTEGQNSAQRRLSADSVLDRAGVLPESRDLAEDDQEIKIKEIRVHLADTAEQEPDSDHQSD